MAKSKGKRDKYRWYNEKTGEHYTVILSRNAYDKLKDSERNKYSKKEKKHIKFKLIKKVS